MPPKRKSDAVEADTPAVEKRSKVQKKSKTSDASEASASQETEKPKTWNEVVLENEDEEGGVPVYDDCNEIRRKIRLLQKQPDFKITTWLRDIGKVNNNSYQRFMKASGPTGGAGNGTYYAAYVYFEKVRILEGKKKTAKRQRNEVEHPDGFPLVERRHLWVQG